MLKKRGSKMENIMRISGKFCIVATLIPFIPSDLWFVRMFDFPFAQITFLTLLSLIGILVFSPLKEKKSLLLSFLLLAALVYQTTIIFPYTPVADYQVLQNDASNRTSSIRLLSANVFMENRNSALLLKTIAKHDPDVILVLEADKWWQDQLLPIEKEYAYQVPVPLDNTYGMLLYSKLPLVGPEVKYLVKADIPSIQTKVKLRSGQLVQLYAVHPEPPSPTESQSSAPRDGELMIIGKKAAQDSLPVVVVGDLNDVAWSETTRQFQKISRLLDPRIGRGFFNTFNANYPLLRWPLDHLFHSNHFKLNEIKRLPDVDSDHFPILVDLGYHPRAELQQEEPKASPDDHKEALKQINKVK